MRPRSTLRFALAFVLAACGCAEPHLPLPITAAELVTHRSGPALVAYLGQRDASPTVCDLRARGPHLATVDEEVRAALVGGLGDGTIEPERWRRCANALLRSAPRADAAALLVAVGRDYRALIKSSDLEKSPVLQERLRVMQQLYIERRNGFDGDARVLGSMFADLRRALAARRLGPVAAALGQDLLAAVDLEQGRWLGRPVDAPMIDALFAARDERALRRFADRLPAPALRDEARRRVIRIHVAASPFPEVRGNAAAVEQIMMKRGVYAIPIADHRPARGWLEAGRMPARGVIVRQRVWRQTAKLLAYSGDRPGLSVLPEVQLRDALMVEVEGISRPVTLCGPARKLDPTPCIAVEDVKLENPAAYLDKGGVFRFVDDISMRDAVDLTRMRDRFELPVSIGGQRLLTFDWSLSYERPEDLVFNGPRPGAAGPDLRVVVDHRDPARFVFTVSGGGGTYSAVVEGLDAPTFRVASRGAQGFSGDQGNAGSSGMNGGECQSGSPGGDGGTGGDGGPGGDGGTVVAQVLCGDPPCADAIALLRRIVLSEGGPGGYGGPGGPGGPGGSGGSGRSATTHVDSNGITVTDDQGCSSGSTGSSGFDGHGGSPGPSGRAGRVIVELAR